MLYAILIVGLLAVVGPFLWMLLSSVKPEAEIRQAATWLPETWTLENYRDLFDRLDFPKFFANSAIVALLVTAGQPGLLLRCSATPWPSCRSPAAGWCSCWCWAR